MHQSPAVMHPHSNRAHSMISIVRELVLHGRDVLGLVDRRHRVLRVCRFQGGPFVDGQADEALDHRHVRILNAHGHANLTILRAIATDAQGDSAGLVAHENLHQVVAGINLRRRAHDLAEKVHALSRRRDAIDLNELGLLEDGRGHASRDDVGEGRLQGCAAYEEAVDVGLGDELLAVLRRHAAAVQDTHAIGDLLGHSAGDHLADGRVRILGLVGSGHLARADGPHWLVGDDNLLPILDLGVHRVQLALVDFIRLAGLALLQQLANAEDHGDAGLLALLDLRRGDRIGLPELRPALGVADEGPLDARVLELSGADFAREGSFGRGRNVLRSDLDGGFPQELRDEVDMRRNGANDNLDLVAVGDRPARQGCTQSLGRFHTAVRLPVATDERTARHSS
mmetsp:Transcript_79291/g.256326  ORF Transcript_79291/g.256326 Transcript_79291/m.256326 type:complete len:397 (-) Transcript_79291:80-1270(-)